MISTGSTITTMSVLIIYDGWQHLKLINVAAVILGPILAMFIAHDFSGALARHIEVGRILSRREWGGIVGTEAPFLLLWVPPIAVVSFLYALGTSLSCCIRVTVLLGTASLGYWGFVVGRRAHFTGWRLVGAVMAGLLIGVVIRLIQVFLQPGKVMSGGVALGPI